jgi:hypothetical protein
MTWVDELSTRPGREAELVEIRQPLVLRDSDSEPPCGSHGNRLPIFRSHSTLVRCRSRRRAVGLWNRWRLDRAVALRAVAVRHSILTGGSGRVPARCRLKTESVHKLFTTTSRFPAFRATRIPARKQMVSLHATERSREESFEMKRRRSVAPDCLRVSTPNMR